MNVILKVWGKSRLALVLCSIAAIVFVLSSSAPAVSSSTTSSEAQSGSLDFVIGNGSEPRSLDPSLINAVPEHRIYMALFEGLVTYDPKTSFAAPGLAESWSFSPNGLQLTFKLRKATWSDGKPITAQNVVDSWLRTLDPETDAEYAYMITMAVRGAEDFNSGKAPASQVGIRALNA